MATATTEEILDQQWTDTIDAGITELADKLTNHLLADRVTFIGFRAYRYLLTEDGSLHTAEDIGALNQHITDWILDREGEKVNEILFANQIIDWPNKDEFYRDNWPAESPVPESYQNHDAHYWDR